MQVIGSNQGKDIEHQGLLRAIVQAAVPGRIHQLDAPIDTDNLNQITGVLAEILQ